MAEQGDLLIHAEVKRREKLALVAASGCPGSRKALAELRRLRHADLERGRAH